MVQREKSKIRGVVFSSYPSPIGDIFAASSQKGLIEVRIKGGRRAFIKGLEKTYQCLLNENSASFKRLFRLFDKYFRGIEIEFDIRLDAQGTAFEKKVWNALRKIPYGKVKTYGEIAKEISMPKAARAVGRACGKNPLPIIIPCHRVVSSGGMGGYSGGMDVKVKLLTLEGHLKV